MEKLFGKIGVDLQKVQQLTESEFDQYMDELHDFLCTVRGWKRVAPTEPETRLRPRSQLEQALYDRINGTNGQRVQKS
jgi:hypothetical protein